MQRRIDRALAVAATLTFVAGAPALAQYREYYVRGKVVDTQKQPIPNVEIQMRDPSTNMSYNMKTGKDGSYKYAGIPHGTYQVTLTRAGYRVEKVEWKFEAPQDTMQRMDIPDIVLVSQDQVQQVEEAKAVESGTKEAAEKISQRDFDGAIPLLKALLDKNPRNVNALFFLGISYAGKKMFADAVDALTKVAEINPAFPGVQFELGICHRQLGDNTKALAAYDKSLEQDAANADGAYNSALILFETSRIDEALARFERVVALKPADPDALEMAGRCYIRQSKFPEALERIERARAATTDTTKAASLDDLLRQLRPLAHP